MIEKEYKAKLAEYRRATWQYLLDHCTNVNPRNGYYRIHFYIPSKEELEKRILARTNGYHRANVQKIEEQKKEIEKNIRQVEKKWQVRLLTHIIHRLETIRESYYKI